MDLEGSYTGAGTLSDPFLGLFNSDCGLLAVDDDGGAGVNSRLSVVVPDDGQFVLAVTLCCDGGFSGGGVGTYLLSLTQLMTIDSISGQLVNATTSAPLSGSYPTYASAYLLRCNDGNCFEYVSYVQAGDDGSFSFELDQYGNSLAVGTYQVQAYANGFEPFGSEICNYSIEITNRGVGRRYNGQAWSIVEFYHPTNNYAVTRFQVGRNGFRNPLPEQLNLKRGQSETLTFKLEVPASAPVGSTVCTYIAVGKDPVPKFNSQGNRPIFCSYKHSDGVMAMSAKESRKWLEKRKNRDRTFTKRPDRGFDESRPF